MAKEVRRLESEGQEEQTDSTTNKQASVKRQKGGWYDNVGTFPKEDFGWGDEDENVLRIKGRRLLLHLRA
jgi:hypothetical protein